jgi:hypothetical protein
MKLRDHPLKREGDNKYEKADVLVGNSGGISLGCLQCFLTGGPGAGLSRRRFLAI